MNGHQHPIVGLHAKARAGPSSVPFSMVDPSISRAFGDGIAADSVRLERRGDDLYAQVGGPSGSVTLRGWFAPGAARVERMRFADGTTWNADTMAAMVTHTNQGNGAAATATAPNQGASIADTSGGTTTSSGTSSVPTEPAAGAVDSSAAIADQLAQAPHYDFEALLHAVNSGEGDYGLLTPGEIARRWARVAAASSAAAAVGGDDAGAGSHVPAWARGGPGAARTWGFEGSTGAATGIGELRTLQGLGEGFSQIGMS